MARAVAEELPGPLTDPAGAAAASSPGRVYLVGFMGSGKTTIPLHLRLLDDPDVRRGRFSTKWLERWLLKHGPG